MDRSTPPHDASPEPDETPADGVRPEGMAAAGEDQVSRDRDSDAPPDPEERSYRTPLLLFLATLLSVFLCGAFQEYPPDQPFTVLGLLGNMHRGWTFAVPLMAILVTHELGHYVAALYHRVPASLPYFIPVPPLLIPGHIQILSPFGTMGAVISMPDRIRSRNALLDTGAAGPIAGMVVAIPVLIIGLAQSPVSPSPLGALQEGNCLLYWLLKRIVLGEIPVGHDVMLSPTAFAGWTGLLVTSLNLIPIGQLDGGHIAYALFGEKQDFVARFLHYGLLAAFGYNLMRFGNLAPGMVWLVWFLLLGVFRQMSGGNHPPTDHHDKLTVGRRAVAIICLLLFVVLFMPTPLREADPPLLTPQLSSVITQMS